MSRQEIILRALRRPESPAQVRMIPKSSLALVARLVADELEREERQPQLVQLPLSPTFPTVVAQKYE